MWNKIKIFLWQCNILKKDECPICGKLLIKKGYDIDDEPGLENYICTDDYCILNVNKGYCMECGLKLNNKMLLYEDGFCSLKCHNKYHGFQY